MNALKETEIILMNDLFAMQYNIFIYNIFIAKYTYTLRNFERVKSLSKKMCLLKQSFQ